MTSTATLQAALDVMGNSEPSIGYSIAYPFGVIGPILCIYFMTRHVKPKFPPKAQHFHMAELTLGDGFRGNTIERTQRAAAGRRPGDDDSAGRSKRRSGAGACDRDGRRRDARGRRAKYDCRSRETARQARARPHRQRPLGAGLHPRLRRQGESGRHPAGTACAAERLSHAHAARPPLRHGHRAAAGSRRSSSATGSACWCRPITRRTCASTSATR